MIKEKIKTLLPKLYEGVIEKEEAIQLALLASLAGESIFLLGSPGVAKSLIARRLKYAFKDATSFEYLMSRFSTPDEVFGPVSIKQLKDNDQYVRLTSRYLPGSQIVFLDEIWKAGPPIQNALLTVLNEKIYRNGEKEVAVDLRGLISASNELPAKDQGLEALWDRFLIRLVIQSIENRENFEKMITNSANLYQDNIETSQKITTQEYQSWSQKISEIKVTNEVLDIIDLIRKAISQRNENKKIEDQIVISDRRWKKIVRLLRTSAFVNERPNVDLMDCFLIPHCIWNNPDQSKEVWKLVSDIIQKNGYQIGLPIPSLRKAIEDFKDEVDGETQYEKTIKYKTRAIYKENGNEYYRIKDFGDVPVKDCQTEKKSFSITKKDAYYSRYSNYTAIILSETKIKIDENTYNFELEEKEKKEKATKKAHPAVQKQWDATVSKLFQECQELMNKIESYKTNDQKHITTNVFVSATLADVVFTNLHNMARQIQDLKVEIGKIKHYYETLQ